MENELLLKYESLLKRTILGVRIRKIIFGHNSKVLERYLNSQDDKIYSIVNQAYDEKKKSIHSRSNLCLERKLIDLSVERDYNLIR